MCGESVPCHRCAKEERGGVSRCPGCRKNQLPWLSLGSIQALVLASCVDGHVLLAQSIIQQNLE